MRARWEGVRADLVRSVSTLQAERQFKGIHEAVLGRFESPSALISYLTSPSGDLDEKDNEIDSDYNSTSVATSERERIEAALTAAAATPVLFAKDSDVVDAGPRAALTAFAHALVAKQPSDPLIPIQLLGFASADGQAAHNRDLSTRRAEAVRGVLTSAGAPQPIAETYAGHAILQKYRSAFVNALRYELGPPQPEKVR